MDEKYLKPYQYYVDLYDKLTVEYFRDKEKRWRVPVTEKKEGEDESALQERLKAVITNTWSNVAIEIMKPAKYRDKKKTIQEWMKRDQEYDDIYQKAVPISHIQCLTCNRMMFVSMKTLDIGYKDKPTRVLFMYDCPLGHLPRRAFYNDGEEYRHSPTVCSKCRFAVDEKTERNGQLLKITATCKQCGNVDITDFDFSPKEEKPDPDFVKDRERFCLTDEEGEKEIGELVSFEARMKLLDEQRVKDSKCELYDKAKLLKKLTIVQLEELLVPVLEKSNFIKLILKEPETNRDFILPFVVYDSKPDRTDAVSSSDLKKIVVSTLKGTNWKLMNDSVMYRMGMLEGRLKGYEREDDLVKLIENEIQK